MSEWVDVKKCKPPIGVTVLVVTKNNHGKEFSLGYHDGLYWFFYGDKRNLLEHLADYKIEITHWMHLPQFP